MPGGGLVNTDLAERVSGRAAPHAFPVLDASIADLRDTHRIIREDIKQNRIRYEFPAGFNKLDLFEECRALTKLDDFDTMYDITMQMLVNKDVVIKMLGNDDEYATVCEFHVTDRYQDLRGNDIIDKYPVLITWLTQFMADELLKKYPLPGSETPPTTAAKKKEPKRAGDGKATSGKEAS